MPVISSWTFSFTTALIWCSVLLGNHLFTPLKATDLPHRWVYGDAPAPHLTSSDVFLTARNPDLNVHQDSSQKLRKNVIIWSSLGCPLSSFQLLSRVRLFVIPWIAARQASLSITNSRSSLRLNSIESVMPFRHLILGHPLLLLPPIPPSIKVFSNESTLCMRWPKYWSFSFSIIPSKEIPGLISSRMDRVDLLAVQGTLKSLLQHHSSKASILWHSAFFTVQLSHPYMTTGKP